MEMVSGLGFGMDIVADDEIIYRCIFYGRDWYIVEADRLRISSQAFSDRNQMPSVDRAILQNHDPKKSQRNPEDGVLSLVVADIRQIDSVQQLDAKGKPIQTYKIDVVADPIMGPIVGNLAHAEVRPTPQYQTKSVFRKLQERLAILAMQRIEQQGWNILPLDLRSNQLT
jgi:hypothetical protein